MTGQLVRYAVFGSLVGLVLLIVTLRLRELQEDVMPEETATDPISQVDQWSHPIVPRIDPPPVVAGQLLVAAELSEYKTVIPDLNRLIAQLPWEDYSDDWLEPTPERMRSWLTGRMGDIQDFVRDNGVESLQKYGWNRKWPPVEGFLTEYDLDRLTRDGFEHYQVMMQNKVTEHAVRDLARHAPQLAKANLRDLALSYKTRAEAAWRKVFEGDPYPYDVMGLAYRVGAE